MTATIARTISKGLAPILERLELDRPQVVTLRDVEKICVEESAEEWLPDVMAEMTIDATLEELRDKSTATVQRTGYLLQGARPDIADEVVRAIARANKWVVAPAGDAALNRLGLDTQVPAKLTYVSSGPYKSYEYGNYEIELKHRANRDLLDCSPITRTVVQALKALGKDGVDGDTIATLARNLTGEQVGTLVKESAGLTSWLIEAIKRIREAKRGQDR